MKWGVFRQREHLGEVHVIPAYSDGFISPWHKVDVLCPCNPEPEDRVRSTDKLIVVHKED